MEGEEERHLRKGVAERGEGGRGGGGGGVGGGVGVGGRVGAGGVGARRAVVPRRGGSGGGGHGGGGGGGDGALGFAHPIRLGLGADHGEPPIDATANHLWLALSLMPRRCRVDL